MRKFNAICKELDDERDTRKSNDEIYTIMKADAKRAGLIKEDTDMKEIKEIKEETAPMQEKEEMDEETRETLQELKEKIIGDIIRWYDDGFPSIIYDSLRDNSYSAREIAKRALRLTGGSHAGCDMWDDNCCIISKAIIGYIEERPLEWFEDIDDDYEIEDIMDDAYSAADFELQDIPSHKDVFIDAVREAPDEVFEGDEELTPEEVREELIYYYEGKDDFMFEADAYDASYIDVYRLYDTMREDAIRERILTEARW